MGEIRTGWDRIKKLLVMRLDNMGDVVMTGPALRAIREALPGLHLTLMASPAGTRVASLLPWVDDVLTYRVLWQDLGSLPFNPGREWEMIRRLEEHGFEAAIILTSFSQSPFAAGVACLLAGIPLRAAASKESDAGVFTTLVKAPPDHVHQVDRNNHLVKGLGFAVTDGSLHVRITETARQSVRNLLLSRGIDGKEGFILLHPTASARARTYPAARFALAGRAVGEQSGLPVLVTGGGNERELGEDMAQTIGPQGINLSGLTTPVELAALVSEARLVLTNNTMTMHLADALGTPAVVLYSGTELESQWQPRSTPHILLRRPTPCTPCYAFDCPYHLECLDIPPEEVSHAAIRLLSRLS